MSIQSHIQEGLVLEYKGKEIEALVAKESGVDFDIHATLREMEAEMLEAAETLEFERAAMLRDQIKELRSAAGLKEEPQAIGKSPRRATRYPTGRKRKGK
jgi:excinuclease ABC subunit B